MIPLADLLAEALSSTPRRVADKSTATETLLRAEKSTATQNPQRPVGAEKSTATGSPEPPAKAEKGIATESPVPWQARSCNLELVVGNFRQEFFEHIGDRICSGPREFADRKWRLVAVPQHRYSFMDPVRPHIDITILPDPVERDRIEEEFISPVCAVEIVNWFNEDKSLRLQVEAGTWTRADLDLHEEDWFGPAAALWVRAVLKPPKAPALSENQVEVLVTEVTGTDGRALNLSKLNFKKEKESGLAWRMSVTKPPPGGAPATPIRVSLESRLDDENLPVHWPLRAKYKITIVNWLAWAESVHVSGHADFTKASGTICIEVPPPAGGLSRESGWLGPGDALWVRASLTKVGIKHAFRFMPRDVVLDLDTLQKMQDMQRKGVLVTKTVELSFSCVGKFTEEYCAVSHYWNGLAQPDKDGAQLAALKQHLLTNPAIQFVWFDFCCLPQRDSGTKKRTEAEEKEFRDGLRHVYLLFLNVSVLILYDLHFVNRFWPLWEAWLAMHTPTASGLQLAPAGPQQRWTIIDLQGDGKTQGAGSLLAWWVHEHPDQDTVFKYLARDDVTVTNNSDKQVQFEVLSNINEEVQAALE
mmetsp:Transcript_31835/g.74387  ORF Transcript_31835/g.74387 Transcript_31835/m.74387 type:complete len:587 (+) Transcript_31835:36-1796(+)